MESLPIEARTMNALTERLRFIEMRLPIKHKTEAFLANLERELKVLKKKTETKLDKKKNQKCYICNKTSYFKIKCPERSNKDFSSKSSMQSKKDTQSKGEAFISTVMPKTKTND